MINLSTASQVKGVIPIEGVSDIKKSSAIQEIFSANKKDLSKEDKQILKDKVAYLHVIDQKNLLEKTTLNKVARIGALILNFIAAGLSFCLGTFMLSLGNLPLAIPFFACSFALAGIGIYHGTRPFASQLEWNQNIEKLKELTLSDPAKAAFVKEMLETKISELNKSLQEMELNSPPYITEVQKQKAKEAQEIKTALRVCLEIKLSMEAS